MEEIRTTDPMVIPREKVRDRLSRNLLIREAAYDTMMNHTVLPLCQIKTIERDTKRRRVLCTTKTSGEYDGFRLNPDSSSVMYMTAVKEAQCCIADENKMKQDELKQNVIRANSVKREVHILKRGSS